MEHLQHFGLRQDPFQNEPDLRFYFESAAHSDPQRRVERGLRQSKGLTVMTGDPGTGKTLLTRRIFEGLEEELFDAQLMMMVPGATDAGSILRRYARLLGVEDCSVDRPTLLAEVYEKLAIVREDGRHAVLILDDAHLLNMDSLAEVGGLLNLEYEDRRLLSLLLVGLPQLDITLSHEASLGQRVDVRTRIEPLNLSCTAAYLLHRMALAGGDQTTIVEDAISSLHKFGRGRPRLLNTLADNGLFEAYLEGRTNVSSSDIERAAADLGIGSDPGTTYTAASSSFMPGPGAGGFDAREDDGFDIQSSSFDTGLGVDSIAAFEEPGASPAKELGLSELIDDTPPSAIAEAELTTVIPMAEFSTDGADELDDVVQEVLAEGEVIPLTEAEADLEFGSALEELPEFQGQNAANVHNPEATRIALPAEQLSSEEGDEFDELFVELIDD